MTNEIAWYVELAVKPGKLAEFQALTHEMVEATKGEPGSLIYERFVNADGTLVYGYERYADADAAVAHLVAFGTTYRDRFVATVERKRFTVFGLPSAELTGILDTFGATYQTPFGGFSRVTGDQKSE